MDLEFSINNQTLKRTDHQKVVNESIQYLRLNFTSSTDWTGQHNRYVFFRHNGKNYPYPIQRNGTVMVPVDFLTNDRLIFGVYGIITQAGTIVNRITTNMLSIPLGESGLDKDTAELDPTIWTETILEEIQNEIGELGENKVDKEPGKDLFSGSYEDLTNKPTIPSLTSQLTNDTGYVTQEHTHTKMDITDFTHNHDERYYTQTQTQTLLQNLQESLLNRFNLTTNKTIITPGEVSDVVTYWVQNGVPMGNQTIYFFEEYNPTITISSDKDTIEQNEQADITIRLRDEDGSAVQNTSVYYFIKEE